MSPSEIPNDVTRFLRTHVRSALQLELLVLLHRDAERWWSAEALDKQLRLSVEAVVENLQALEQSGLVETRGDHGLEYRYRAPSGDDAAAVNRLADLFKTHFHALVHAIYAGRRQGMEDFANAFKLKKPGANNDG